MDLRQLEHFVAVAEEQHFTRAARRLNIVQSGLSTSIRALEEELGAELFLRSTRRVDLTTAGHVLLQEARRVLIAARKAKEAVSAIQGLQRGTLSIGTVQDLAPFVDLPGLLSRFHADYPAIEIWLCQGDSASLLDKIREGRLDLAFVPLFGLSPGGAASRMIACEPLVAACSPSHPLAGREDVALADLAEETFVDFQAEWGTRRLVDLAFATARIDRHIAFEVSDIRTLLDLVSLGLGIALVPEQTVVAAESLGKAPAALAFARLAPPEICWELAVFFAGGEEPVSATARAFLALL
jgi:DNA-binding transcriptional LysR family regulator